MQKTTISERVTKMAQWYRGLIDATNQYQRQILATSKSGDAVNTGRWLQLKMFDAHVAAVLLLQLIHQK